MQPIYDFEMGWDWDSSYIYTAYADFFTSEFVARTNTEVILCWL